VPSVSVSQAFLRGGNETDPKTVQMRFARSRFPDGSGAAPLALTYSCPHTCPYTGKPFFPFATFARKYLKNLVGAQGLEPWTR
jgi:hypothetical protein